MSDAQCPHCGAERTPALTCPVCELRYDAHSIEPAATPLGRAWQSGRLPLGLSCALLAIALFVPFATMRLLSIADSPPQPVTLLDMALQSGPLGREIKSLTVLAVPFAAALMAQFLFTRTTGSAMRATRPLLFMLSALPLVSMLTGFLRLKKSVRHEVALSVAPALVALAAIAGVIAAVRFGTAVPERKPKRAASGPQDEDDE